MATYIDVLISNTISLEEAKRLAEAVKQAIIAAGADPETVHVDATQVD